MMMESWLLPPVDDPAGPDGAAYLRRTFPYRLPPLARFEPEPVPLDPAPAIWITDTTFRDGQQSRSPYTPEQIADLYPLLARLGGPERMIRPSEFFLYTPKDRRGLGACPGHATRPPATNGRSRAP